MDPQTPGEPASTVSVTFSQDEALVLFEWLKSFNEAHHEFAHQAEQRVLWDLEAMLERSLDGLFSPDYTAHLKAAREHVQDPSD